MKRKLMICLLLFLTFTYAYTFTRIGGFYVNDIDESDPDRQYYGYNTSYNSEWYIVRVTSETARYRRGNENYEAEWSSRTISAYVPFSLINQTP